MLLKSYGSKLYNIMRLNSSKSYLFSQFYHAHKQWRDCIEDKILNEHLNNTDLKEINERVLNIEELNHLCQVNSLSIQPSSLFGLLTNKLCLASESLFKRSDYKRSVLSLMSSVENLASTEDKSSYKDILSICEQYCHRFLMNRNESDFHPRSEEIGQLCRIISFILKEGIKVEELYLNVLVQELERILDAERSSVDMTDLLKYLLFVEQVKVNYLKKLENLEHLIKLKIDEEVTEKSFSKLQPEDLLVLNESLCYFLREEKFMDYALQKLVYTNILETGQQEAHGYIMNRILSEYTSILNELNFDEIQKEKSLNVLYEYLIFVMKAADVKIIKSRTMLIKKMPSLWSAYIRTIPNKRILSELEKNMQSYLQFHFTTCKADDNLVSISKESLNVLTDFLMDYSNFLESLPRFNRKEFFDMIRISPAWIVDALNINPELLKELELTPLLTLMKLVYFSDSPQQLKQMLAKEARSRFDHANKTMNVYDRNQILKCLSEVKFLNDKELENLSKDYTFKEYSTGPLSQAKKPIFIDFLHISTFGKRHNEFLNLLSIFQKSLNSGVLSGEDYLQLFIFILEQGTYNDDKLNQVCLINIKSHLQNAPLARLVELTTLIFRHLDYFLQRFPSQCKWIFEMTFEKLKEKANTQRVYILYIAYMIALNKKDSSKILENLKQYTGDDIFKDIKFYSSVFKIQLEKHPDVQMLKKIGNESWLITKNKKWIALQNLTPKENDQLEKVFKQPLETDKDYSKPTKSSLKIVF